MSANKEDKAVMFGIGHGLIAFALSAVLSLIAFHVLELKDEMGIFLAIASLGFGAGVGFMSASVALDKMKD